MAIFERMDRLVSRTVDRVNAIPFVLAPISKTPNGRGGHDPHRKVVTGYGVLSYMAAEFGVQLGVRRSYREANDLRAIQSGREPELSVDRRYFCGVENEPRQDDIVTFPTKPDLPDFQVVGVRRDGLARLVLVLVQLGGQA